MSTHITWIKEVSGTQNQNFPRGGSPQRCLRTHSGSRSPVRVGEQREEISLWVDYLGTLGNGGCPGSSRLSLSACS